MNTTERNDTEIFEMMQTLMNEGLQGFPAVMARMYNLAMQFERELHLGAGKYERTEERRGYANGYKPKTLNTHAGRLTLQIPQVRDSDTPFYPRSLERGTRCERALKLAVAEMYIKGVSTRKVQAVFDKLCDVNITADQVSRAMREMDDELDAWRNRPIGAVKALFLDATYHKARVNGIVVSVATFVVAGILDDGHRAILAVDSDLSENEVHWRRVLSNLVERGMRGVKLIASTDGARFAYVGDRSALPYGHAFRVESNRKKETALYRRSAYDPALLSSACAYNHLMTDQADMTWGTFAHVYDRSLGIGFKRFRNGPMLNLCTPARVRDEMNAASGSELLCIGNHEQYFHKEYFAWQPDYAEKVLVAAKMAHDAGRDFIFMEDTM